MLRSTEVHPVFSGLFPSTPKETKHAHGTGACCSAAITAIATNIAPFPIPTTTPRPPPSSSASACYYYYYHSSNYDCKYLFTYLPTFLLAYLLTYLSTHLLTYYDYHHYYDYYRYYCNYYILQLTTYGYLLLPINTYNQPTTY